ncbi:MAG TPA: thiamine pyrophosphate-binding protein [Streptosporangiaceae bacterium]|jgi:acetolactate synthase-1/2/3 large subunit
MADTPADPPGPARTGADALAGALLRHAGRPTVFLVTGNQNLPLVDSLGRRDVRLVHTRHESGAGYMAEGWARSSGEPGVYLVTAGPGLTSALTPLASARAAEVPVILLSASHPREHDGMGAFQELDQVQLTRHLCKASIRCLNGDQAAAVLDWAWQQAAEFPPGPVHVELPADVLTEPAPADRPVSWSSIPLHVLARPGQQAGAALLRRRAQKIARSLLSAKRPLILLRPALGRCAAAADLGRHVPVLTVESPRGLRDPAWVDEQELIGSADHIALLAPADYAVGFGAIGSAQVHAYPEAGPALLADLATLLGRERPAAQEDGPQAAGPAAGGTVAARRAGERAGPACSPPHPLDVAAAVDRAAGGDAVLAIDGGEFCQWIRHGLRGRLAQQLINGKLGAIGGSIPLAIGASLHAPGRPHLAFTGDGSFGYYSAEIDTAVRHGARLTIVVGVDGSWGSEWHQQQARFGGRSYATAIGGPRYSLVAQGYGAHGSEADDAAQFERQLTAALAGAGVSCLAVRIQRAASPAL